MILPYATLSDQQIVVSSANSKQVVNGMKIIYIKNR